MKIKVSDQSPNDLSICDKKLNYIIVSYHTIDPRYCEHSKSFVRQIIQSGLSNKTIVFDIGNVKSWRHAVLFKPTLLRTFAEKHDKSILYLDIDSRVKSNLNYFSQWVNYDYGHIGVRRRVNDEEVPFYLTGTLFFNRKNQGIQFCSAFLRDWQSLCRGRIDSGFDRDDQTQFEISMNSFESSGGLVTFLHPKYCFIHDIDKIRYPNIQPEIVHYQEHRNGQ
jgi:hypothetical protein